MAPILISPDATQSTTSDRSDRHIDLTVPFTNRHAAGKGVVVGEAHIAKEQERSFEGENVLPHVQVEKPHLSPSDGAGRGPASNDYDSSSISTIGACSVDDQISESCVSGSFEVINMTHCPSMSLSGHAGHTGSPERIPSAAGKEHPPKLPPRPYNHSSLNQMSEAVPDVPQAAPITTENFSSSLPYGGDTEMVLAEFLAPVYGMQKVMDGLYLKQSYRKCFTLHPNAFDQVFIAETRTRVVLSSRKTKLAERLTALRDLSKCLVGCFEVAMWTPNIGTDTPIACLMISEIVQALKTKGDQLGCYDETDLTHLARMVLADWKQNLSGSELISLLYTLHRHFRSGGDVDSFYWWIICILPTGDNKRDADEVDDEGRERQDGIPRFE